MLVTGSSLQVPEMKQSTLSMWVFCIYMLILGTIFMFFPNHVITLLGFEPATDVWIHILALVLYILSFYYYLAIKEEAYNFYRWTTYGRMPIFFVLLAFVLLDMGPPILLVFGVFESGCAIWTRMSLKKEQSY